MFNFVNDIQRIWVSNMEDIIPNTTELFLPDIYDIIEKLHDIEIRVLPTREIKKEYGYSDIYGLFDYTKDQHYIILNKHYVMNWEELHFTIAHELIHAAQYYIDGEIPEDEHSGLFEKMAYFILVNYGVKV